MLHSVIIKRLLTWGIKKIMFKKLKSYMLKNLKRIIIREACDFMLEIIEQMKFKALNTETKLDDNALKLLSEAVKEYKSNNT